MELRQLVYVQAVARCGGFTRAAERLTIAQPAISAQVRRLEREVGIEIFRRTSRSVELTDAGAAFLRHVELALAHVDAARAAAEAHREVDQGQLRLGATPITGSLDLVGALGDFRRRYPGVTIGLQTATVAELLSQLREGRFDVVVAPRHDDDLPADLLSSPIADERLVVITPPGDPRRISSVVDIADDVFACLPAGSGLHDLLHDMFAAMGRAPNVAFETPEPARLRELVAAGLASALIAQSVAVSDGHPVSLHQLPEVPPHPPIHAFRRSTHTPAVALRFVEHLLAGGRRA